MAITVTTGGPIVPGDTSTTYSDLQASVASWLARNDLTGNIPEFIKLAESRLNRELPEFEDEAILTGTIGSRSIDISDLNVNLPKALFWSQGASYDEVLLDPGSRPNSVQPVMQGAPCNWYMTDTDIVFDRQLDQAYAFRFVYQTRFALSDTAPTNWLLNNHYDVYLAASVAWGGAFVQSQALVAPFLTLLESELPKVRRQINMRRNQRSPLKVDAGLRPITPLSYQSWATS